MGDRTYKLCSGTTSEPGRYVKSLGEPRGVITPLQVFERFATVVRDEDYPAASLAQRSANAGLQDSFLFGRNEPTLHHYHNTYRKVLGEPPLESV